MIELVVGGFMYYVISHIEEERKIKKTIKRCKRKSIPTRLSTILYKPLNMYLAKIILGIIIIGIVICFSIYGKF